ncbi:dihydrofolate reductase family protein [Streptodolium elevatio]|uniref:Dihydrofolate reductase family protein n=1 Tax=Streptodolium elevatio TaxID=3157996 RepID=A0ABV3DNH5_9ACTN
MKLTATTFITIDGVYQAPGGPDEDRSDGFPHGGWAYPYDDKDFGAFMDGIFGQVDAFLLGRKTYDIFAAYWPKVTDPDNPIAGRLNSLPKYVPSSTLTSPEWAETRVLTGDLREEVTALKAQPGRELQVHGSGRLVGSLLTLGLVDTLHLLTFPVVLGTGKRLFPESALPSAFGLASSRPTSTGVVINTYARTGEPTYGDFGAED